MNLEKLIYSREFLIELRDVAEKQAKIVNPHWARMYLNLAMALDHLDAANARSGAQYTISNTFERSSHEGT